MLKASLNMSAFHYILIDLENMLAMSVVGTTTSPWSNLNFITQAKALC